jgi:hypothetical protein
MPDPDVQLTSAGFMMLKMKSGPFLTPSQDLWRNLLHQTTLWPTFSLAMRMPSLPTAMWSQMVGLWWLARRRLNQRPTTSPPPSRQSLPPRIRVVTVVTSSLCARVDVSRLVVTKTTSMVLVLLHMSWDILDLLYHPTSPLAATTACTRSASVSGGMTAGIGPARRLIVIYIYLWGELVL